METGSSVTGLVLPNLRTVTDESQNKFPFSHHPNVLMTIQVYWMEVNRGHSLQNLTHQAGFLTNESPVFHSIGLGLALPGQKARQEEQQG